MASQQTNLKKYHQKRNFKKTSEPKGGARPKRSDPIFVIQRHEASHLHYDFRLELDGVLKSWAVPKEPTMDPSVKRLAVEVEDHPLEYASFSGDIPKGQYGGGHVDIWDHGTWASLDADSMKAYKAGKLSFTLSGARLSGRWTLVRTRGMAGNSRQNSWLQMKSKDVLAQSRGPATKKAAASPTLDLKSKKTTKKVQVHETEPVLSSPGRLLFPEASITKAHLADYYDAVAERMLPLVLNRPLSFVRCPAGREKACFFQQHYKEGLGPGIEPVMITEKAKKRAEHPILVDERGLRSLAQVGVLELHTWGSLAEQLETPDQLVFDFDPDPGVDWKDVIKAARSLKSFLEELELTPFLKLSGGKGLHIHVPVVPEVKWPKFHAFAEAIANEMVKREPKRFVASSSKDKRKGLIYLDYQRNSRGATFVAPYSTRARDNAPVALPIPWEDLNARLKPNQFTLKNVKRRLSQPDPWADFADSRGELKQF